MGKELESSKEPKKKYFETEIGKMWKKIRRMVETTQKNHQY